eukprot:4075646-Amphidinium_carterae.1
MWQWWLSSKLGSRVEVGAGGVAGSVGGCDIASVVYVFVVLEPVVVGAMWCQRTAYGIDSKVAKWFLTKFRSWAHTRHIEELECT